MEKVVSIYREISSNEIYGSKAQVEKRITRGLENEYSDYLNSFLNARYDLYQLFFIKEETKQDILKQVIEEVFQNEFEEYKIAIEIP